MTRTELGDEMKRQFEIEYTAEELKLMDGSYKVMGLVPPSLNVNDTMTKLLTEEVGGFYDPRTKAMVLVREDDRKSEPGFFGRLFGAKPAFDKEEQKITLAHELTHALQDQHYGLQAMQEAIEKDDDMLMAFSALVEGDATLVMFGEMGRQEGDIQRMTEMDPRTAEFMFGLMKMALPFAGGKTYRNAPPIFRDGLIFPYFQGMVFNLNLSRKGGFDRIHQAYQSPPVSTEQILHPEKYFGERDDPMAISIPDAASLLPAPWKHLGGNCLGEFQISILLKQIPGGAEAARGWDGDRYEVYEGDAGRLAMVWYSTWDSLGDAAQFASAFERYCDAQRTERLLPPKLPQRELGNPTTTAPPLSAEESARVQAEWHVQIEIHGSDVSILKGIDREQEAGIEKENDAKHQINQTFSNSPETCRRLQIKRCLTLAPYFQYRRRRKHGRLRGILAKPNTSARKASLPRQGHRQRRKELDDQTWGSQYPSIRRVTTSLVGSRR